MSLLISSLISKLPIETLNSPLLLNSPQVDLKVQEIKLRLPSLVDSKQRALAILFQYINILLFTDDELLAVANLKLEYLESNLFPHKAVSFIDPQAPLYDTGSNRLYIKIPSQQISNAALQMAFSHLNNYSSVYIKELIIALYNLGE